MYLRKGLICLDLHVFQCFLVSHVESRRSLPVVVLRSDARQCTMVESAKTDLRAAVRISFPNKYVFLVCCSCSFQCT